MNNDNNETVAKKKKKRTVLGRFEMIAMLNAFEKHLTIQRLSGRCRFLHVYTERAVTHK